MLLWSLEQSHTRSLSAAYNGKAGKSVRLRANQEIRNTQRDFPPNQEEGPCKPQPSHASPRVLTLYCSGNAPYPPLALIFWAFACLPPFFWEPHYFSFISVVIKDSGKEQLRGEWGLFRLRIPLQSNLWGS